MLNKITSTVFHAAVVLVATAIAIQLTITGHTLLIGGLLMALSAILAAILFGFRLAEGFGTDRLSIWAGPVWAVQPAASIQRRVAARKAA